MLATQFLNQICFFIALGIMGCGQTTSPLPPGTSAGEPDVSLFRMRSLKSLPKVHYSWPISNKALELSDTSELYEYARVTHAVTLRGESCNESHVQTAVAICHRLNSHDPAIKASVGLMYSPWHRKFGKSLPPTDEGESTDAEIQQFATRMATIGRWVASANEKYSSKVELTAVLLDTERFSARAGDLEWNKAITKKYDQFYDAARKAFGSARIEWYGRGVQESATEKGWSPHPWNTFENKGSSFSCSLYRVPEIGVMRETLRRTLALARQHRIQTVTPWVALGAGYRRALDRFQKWDTDWDYDLIYSWMIGAELNRKWFGDRPARFMPGNVVEVVVFYPGPFDPRTPSWDKHFIAYVNGATDVKSLEGGP